MAEIAQIKFGEHNRCWLLNHQRVITETEQFNQIPDKTRSNRKKNPRDTDQRTKPAARWLVNATRAAIWLRYLACSTSCSSDSPTATMWSRSWLNQQPHPHHSRRLWRRLAARMGLLWRPVRQQVSEQRATYNNRSEMKNMKDLHFDFVSPT